MARSCIKRKVPKPCPQHPNHGKSRKAAKRARRARRQRLNAGFTPPSSRMINRRNLERSIQIIDRWSIDQGFQRSKISTQIEDKVDWKTEGF